ncbi:MAG: isoquinoline 1-oxidoreductase beta subunit, partial [Yoonia sp.]
MLRKSTETASYATDVQLDGMKFATVRINPRRSGMLSYEETVATAM